MKKSKERSLHNKITMPPCPPLVDKDGVIKKLNTKLKELNSGNYLIVIKEIKEFRRLWVTYEYYSDIIIHIVDLNDSKRELGVIVPGLGSKPLQLNKNRKLYTNGFLDWFDFEEQLFEVASRWQLTINNEGHYDNK